LFTKTLPLEITLITPLEKIIHDIHAPEIHMNADLTDLTQEGVTVTASVDVTNPNGFDLFLKDVTISFSNDKDASVGSLQMNDVLLPGNDEVTIDITGFLDIAALNADVLVMSLSGSAGISLAGIEKSLSLSTSADIQMPDLNSLLSQTLPTDLVMRGDYRTTFSGLLINVTIEIINPNEIDIQAEDLTVSVYRVDQEDETFITRAELDGGIAEADSSFLTQSDVTIPYRSLVYVPGHFGLPDWICVRVYANMSIPGIDATLWVGICEYQDMHIFR